MYRILHAMLLAGCIVSALSCQHDRGPSRAEDTRWEVYAERSELPHLAAGKTVFVLVYPELHPLSPRALKTLTDAKLRKLCKEDAYIKFLLKYNTWNDTRLHHILDTVEFTKKPFLVCFSPDGRVSAFNPLTLDELDVKKQD